MTLRRERWKPTWLLVASAATLSSLCTTLLVTYIRSGSWQVASQTGSTHTDSSTTWLPAQSAAQGNSSVSAPNVECDNRECPPCQTNQTSTDGRPLQYGSSYGRAKFPHTGDLPENISVVIINWQRPHFVKQSIKTLREYSMIDDILIWHCHPDTAFTVNDTVVRMIHDPAANGIWGLATRFKACGMARNPWVLLIDDDIMLTEDFLADFIAQKRKTPDRIVALDGRDYEGEPRYRLGNVSPGPHKLALTRILLLDQRFCAAFLDFAPLVEDIQREQAVPYWNGEDIFMSLVSYRVSGNRPWIMGQQKGRYKDLHGGKDSKGISTRGGHKVPHLKFRDHLLRESVKRLQLDE